MTDPVALQSWDIAVPMPYLCTDGTGIELGTPLTLTDPMTVSKLTDSTNIQCGICAEEKIASNGITSVPVWDSSGRFKVTASGSITVGKEVAFENGYAHELITDAPYAMGIALETAAAGETLFIKLQPRSTTWS